MRRIHFGLKTAFIRRNIELAKRGMTGRRGTSWYRDFCGAARKELGYSSKTTNIDICCGLRAAYNYVNPSEAL